MTPTSARTASRRWLSPTAIGLVGSLILLVAGGCTSDHEPEASGPYRCGPANHLGELPEDGPVPAWPHAYSQGAHGPRGKIYHAEVDAWNPKRTKIRVLALYAIPPQSRPWSWALDLTGGRLYVGGGKKPVPGIAQTSACINFTGTHRSTVVAPSKYVDFDLTLRATSSTHISYINSLKMVYEYDGTIYATLIPQQIFNCAPTDRRCASPGERGLD